MSTMGCQPDERSKHPFPIPSESHRTRFTPIQAAGEFKDNDGTKNYPPIGGIDGFRAYACIVLSAPIGTISLAEQVTDFGNTIRFWEGYQVDAVRPVPR
jgi:hypothetical protein